MIFATKQKLKELKDRYADIVYMLKNKYSLKRIASSLGISTYLLKKYFEMEGVLKKKGKRGRKPKDKKALLE